MILLASWQGANRLQQTAVECGRVFYILYKGFTWMSSKRYSPACERNKEPLLNVLKKHIPPHAKILEIASGTGQHAEFFTSKMTEWIWQPSDIDETYLNSIEGYRADGNRNNFLGPLKLSTLDDTWDIGQFDAALCCNMIHISPWESCAGLFRHLSKHIFLGGFVAIYGPFIQHEIETASSNVAFDQHLRSTNPAWGIRNIAEVTKLANKAGFSRIGIYDMPANNLTVIYRKDKP